ncbi:MAG: ketoacyl-ACP synthase III [Flavobacteriales bacterium]|nr:ketoacyl-ACP synthase III [Flavobacteriales bacterium]
MCASDLCFEAAEKLLQELNWDKASIDIVIFVSQSSDYYLPATAILLQNRLGLNKSTLAFDVSLGCSGYIYGLNIISSMMSSGILKRGLLLVGDISTNSTNYKDKSSFPLFGDSGSATALEFDQIAKPMLFSMGSDGSGSNAIIIPGGGTRNKFNENSLTEEIISEGITRHQLNIILEGLDIFNFSIKEVPKNISSLLSEASKTVDDIDFFVLHQANRIINETIRKKLKIESEKVPYSIGQYGNTSSGSIPLTIQTELNHILMSGNHRMILSGFGVGLSWGSVMLSTSSLTIPKLIEV